MKFAVVVGKDNGTILDVRFEVLRGFFGGDAFVMVIPEARMAEDMLNVLFGDCGCCRIDGVIAVTDSDFGGVDATFGTCREGDEDTWE